METILIDITLFLLMTFTIFVIIGSFIYFKTTLTRYRWVKLFWALEMIVYLGILVWTHFGGHTTIWVQYLFALLPMSALAYGVIVAFARRKEHIAMQAIEDKLNGEMNKWIEQQIDAMTKKG